MSCRTNLCPANSPFAFLTVMLAQAWDMAAEMCLLQLPALLNGDPEAEFRPSPFFAEQLTAFELWLAHGSAMKQPPEQLPIVLQASLVPFYGISFVPFVHGFSAACPTPPCKAIASGPASKSLLTHGSPANIPILPGRL